jgi:small subunit ribosomal protein S20
MANTKSAAKAARQALKRKIVNDSRRSRVRTSVSSVDAALASGDKQAATTALRAMERELKRAANKGVVHGNAVARKLSRMSKRVKALGKT